MKKFLSILAASTALATPAFAGNVEIPVMVDIEPVAQSISVDWSGFYVGGVASFESGEYSRFESGVFTSGPFVFEPGSMYGAFAGYNFQNNNIVYGGELAYTTGAIGIVSFPTWNYDYIVDAKARVGYAAGRALIYATVGGTFSTWNNDVQGPFPMDGISYGAGIDLFVTDRIFVGAEYLMRDLSADMTSFDGVSTTEHSLQSIAIRVGFNF